MKRAVIALTLLLAVVAGGGVGSVAAQEAENSTATTTAEDTGPDDAVIDVGPYVTVTDYHYSGGEFVVTLHADLPTRVAIADVLGSVQDAGAREVPTKRVMVNGETRVRMQVGTYRGAAAVSVGTANSAVYLSTGIQPINPLAGGSATVGWVGGSVLAISMFIAAAIWVIRQEGGAPEVAGDA